MAKKREAPKPPAVERTLTASLKIKELRGGYHVMIRHVASGTCADGSEWLAGMTIGGGHVVLKRDAQPTRVVHLDDLVAAMLAAE